MAHGNRTGDQIGGVFEACTAPVACIAKSSQSVGKVVSAAASCSMGLELVQVFKPDPAIVGRMVPAYISSALRKTEGSMHSNSLGNEMLLFVAGNMNISRAMKLCGAEAGRGRFMVFATSGRLLKRFMEMSGSEAVKSLEVSMKPGN